MTAVKTATAAQSENRDMVFSSRAIGPAVTSRGDSMRRNHGGACGGLRRLIPASRKSAASASEKLAFQIACTARLKNLFDFADLKLQRFLIPAPEPRPPAGAGAAQTKLTPTRLPSRHMTSQRRSTFSAGTLRVKTGGSKILVSKRRAAPPPA